MRKGIKILLILLLVVILAVIGVVIWQRDNIQALHQGMTMTPEEVQEQLEEQDRLFDETMDTYDVPREKLTPEEAEELISGELTPQEAAQRLIQHSSGSSAPGGISGTGTTSGGGTPAPSSGQSGQPTGSPTQTPEQTKIQEDIAAMYVLRTAYEGKLQSVVQEAIDEYASGGSDGQQKEEIVYSKLTELTALEKNCDQQVADIVKDLREQLKAAGEDDSLAKQVEEAYQTEKSMQKAQYVQRLQGF